MPQVWSSNSFAIIVLCLWEDLSPFLVPSAFLHERILSLSFYALYGLWFANSLVAISRGTLWPSWPLRLPDKPDVLDDYLLRVSAWSHKEHFRGI